MLVGSKNAVVQLAPSRPPPPPEDFASCMRVCCHCQRCEHFLYTHDVRDGRCNRVEVLKVELDSERVRRTYHAALRQHRLISRSTTFTAQRNNNAQQKTP